ncbi:hypothetical protein Dsin_031644 [Dipteronia sinensis]|uniref:START domain-containing protein n=1 Tax=Dipteronia sinensis TaxID=43782 RepID=A0AAD9ZLK6_9ROSI|nr:hypothetical protein Dsin_031644 [Dipteronia sinensis]
MSIRAPTLKDADKPKIFQLAVAAMAELVRMAEMGEPLWTRNYLDGTTVLNENEYIQTLPRWIRPKPVGFQREASRETVVVLMNRVNIIEILMDVNQWSAVFSSIVTQAMTLELLSGPKGEAAGSDNGVLQVMTAEFQVPSPLVPTRQSHYLRYCKQLVEDTWAVVDVSLDSILQPNRAVRCRRRPSGCLIQEMPNGYSKVTWVENVEVDYRGVHDLYMQLVSSGYFLGAKRWVVTLDRHCLRLASNMTTNSHTGDVPNQDEERKCMLKMADRMTISFLAGLSANPAHTWKTVLSGTGADDVRLMTRDSVDDPTRPPGLVLCATTSFRLPVPPIRVFDFLRNDTTRNQWDVLSNEGVVPEIAHIANGWNTSNCVSLLRVLDSTENSSQGNMLLVQESRSDPTAAFVIYAPVDLVAMNEILNGGEYPDDHLTLLPSGFAILPDGTAVHRGSIDAAASGGSLLTVSFQIFVDLVPNPRVSLETIETVINLVACTVENIKASLSCENA